MSAAQSFAQLEPLEQIGKGATSIVKLYGRKPPRSDVNEEKDTQDKLFGKFLDKVIPSFPRTYVKSSDAKAMTFEAVKCIDIFRAKQDASMVKQVMREKEALEALLSRPHPCLIRFHGSCKDDQNLYFLMDWVDGGTLAAHLQNFQRGLPYAHAMAYVQQVTSALEHLHRRGWIHRDLKANNVAIDSASKRCILFDFGCAKSLETDSDRTTTIIGLGHHCAPELVREEPHGRPADMWSLGVLLFELVTGAPPFPYVFANSTEAQCEAVRMAICKSATLILGSDKNSETSCAQDLLSGLLAQNPASRPKAAEALEHSCFKSLEKDCDGLAIAPAPLKEASFPPRKEKVVKMVERPLDTDPFANW